MNALIAAAVILWSADLRSAVAGPQVRRPFAQTVVGPEVHQPRTRGPHSESAFILAGQPVRFDGGGHPQFTDKQTRETAAEVRAGFARWAATPNGRRLIARFNAKEYEIVIAEDPWEEGAGRAPQPALATLVAASDHASQKGYVVIINPEFRITKGRNVFPSGQPATQTDMMAAALAGEMLHVDFYSRGISLPHHHRSDFQDEWRLIARELGYPDMKHQDDDERVVRAAGTH